MKIIAEYFQKPTQEDYFFGAKLPTFDADTMREFALSHWLRAISASTAGTEVVLTKPAVSEPKVEEPLQDDRILQPTQNPKSATQTSLSERLKRIKLVIKDGAATGAYYADLFARGIKDNILLKTTFELPFEDTQYNTMQSNN